MLTVGYRFHPTDEEIINFYLSNKMLGNDYLVSAVAEVDVCKFEPEDLPGLSEMHSDDKEWYFFSPPDYKYTNSQRVNRATKSGHWTPTGKTRPITRKDTGDVIGCKKTLVFYKRGLPKRAGRTNWVMHEYIPSFNSPIQRDFVLCVLKKKTVGNTEISDAEGGGEASQYICPDNADNTEDSTCDEGEASGSGYGSYGCGNYVAEYAFTEDPQLQALVDSFRGLNEQDYGLPYPL